MKDRPNLFKYATSELSQDAFLTWLISWADKDYKEIDIQLNSCAISFIQALLKKGKDFKVESVETGRQLKNIDVWALVNDKYFLVIEDKKGTKEHSNQLQKYSTIAKEEYKEPEIEIGLVYFKMEEQGNYENVQNAKYHHFNRKSMMSILQEYMDTTEMTNQNDILVDFHISLLSLDKRIGSFRSIPLNEKWHGHAWQGFYTELQKKIGGNWDYVSNPSGGFLGFWWLFKKGEIEKMKFQYYLQIEESKLIIKLSTENKNDRIDIRRLFRMHLYEQAKKLNIPISQFGRLGKYMGVAKLDGHYRISNENGNLDFERTIENLREVMNLINETEKVIKSI